jgi:hypothetical protein
MDAYKVVDGAVVWRSGAAIDADGSPRAYHPDSAKGLDKLANAGPLEHPWALACDPSGVEYVQRDTDPAPGFYVSTTSLIDASVHEVRDPRRYVDSEQVAYVTCTRAMRGSGVRMGDLAVACLGDKVVPCIVADVGPHPGEVSIAAARALGIPSDPRTGGVSYPVVSYVIFAGSASSPAWKRDGWEADALDAFGRWGGAARLASALG